ncbi:hypothetical protein CLV47_101118 [Antricoccus suffuscus]|uniref:Lysylphosphatidylglycerol synthase-like protein n=1 Tax=Antricoccus suffuscus TaxID=1629062 RepID=A0A2T1A605_9ACTN|nr:YbhN family protein [Antricoccus suffuscus]PRZ43994.1 hypothetical protein CLV47_101118 [Antricoccus suffuscus]
MTDLLAISTYPAEAPSADPLAPRAQQGRRSDRFATARRVAFGVFVLAMVVDFMASAAPTVVSTIRSTTTASPWWLLTGLACTVASMVAFSALRGWTLAVGGCRISLRQTVPISYAAGAVHTTLPAGAVFSTTYAFRRLRAAGASMSGITWSLTITGLLSTLTLGAIGLLGVALSGGISSSAPTAITQLLVTALVIAGLVRVARKPEALARLAHSVLTRFNTLRQRPVQTGHVRLAEILTDLNAVRSSGRDWLVALTLALTNWFLDLACLAACLAAVGIHVSFAVLLLTYTAGMAAGSLLPLPGGLGAVETTMTLALTVAGAVAAPALAGVLLYRVLSTGSVVVLGWIVIATQRSRTSRTAGRHAPVY